MIRRINDQGKEVPNWDMSVLAGAGGILSTAEDLSKFALAQLDTTNLELAMTRSAYFKVDDNYSMGLGWGLGQSPSGDTWYWHNVGTGGYSSSMIIHTATQNGVQI